MRNAIAAPHRAATAAGERVFLEGGGAVDAAISAALSLSVVYPQDCSIGGDLIALVRSPAGDAWVVNGSGPAPAGLPGAIAESGVSEMPAAGPLTVTVPGALSGLAELHRLGGSLPWSGLFASALSDAEEGVVITPTTARFLADDWRELRRDPGFLSTFADEDGAPLRAGDVLRQPRLAETLRELSASGGRSFYGGAIGARFCDGLSEAGGALRLADLTAYRARIERPSTVQWRGMVVSTSASNTQGPVLLALLAAVERGELDPDPLGADVERLVELAARTAGLRDACVGDGAELSGGPLDWTSAEALDRLLHPEHETRPSNRKRTGGDTVAVAATDAAGWSVSLIQSVYEPFGARILEPRTGIVCHNRGASFTLEAGHVNRLEAGKRPMHTLMPVIVERGGKVYSVQGTMGGKAQPQVHLEFLGSLVSGFAPAEALERPRWVVGGRESGEPGVVQIEAGADTAASRIESRGFRVQRIPALHDAVGHLQAVVYESDGPVAISDPRSDGSAYAG